MRLLTLLAVINMASQDFVVCALYAQSADNIEIDHTVIPDSDMCLSVCIF